MSAPHLNRPTLFSENFTSPLPFFYLDGSFSFLFTAVDPSPFLCHQINDIPCSLGKNQHHLMSHSTLSHPYTCTPLIFRATNCRLPQRVRSSREESKRSFRYQTTSVSDVGALGQRAQHYSRSLVKSKIIFTLFRVTWKLMIDCYLFTQLFH